MDTLLEQQTLAALIAAPAHRATKALERIEADDFTDWRYQTILEAVTCCQLADHTEPGSTLVQIDAHLLASGHYKDHDNGLRQLVADLAGIQGHPDQLHIFTDQLLERRYRRAAHAFATTITTRANDYPVADLDETLAGIDELRRLRMRIHSTTASTSLKGVA